MFEQSVDWLIGDITLLYVLHRYSVCTLSVSGLRATSTSDASSGHVLALTCVCVVYFKLRTSRATDVFSLRAYPTVPLLQLLRSSVVADDNADES
jgi:hypothetical protein